MATPARAEMYEHLVDTLGSYDVHPEERRQILGVIDQAKSWDDLPAEIRTLVGEIETRPRQSWEDPSDVPDNLDEQS